MPRAQREHKVIPFPNPGKTIGPQSMALVTCEHGHLIRKGDCPKCAVIWRRAMRNLGRKE